MSDRSLEEMQFEKWWNSPEVMDGPYLSLKEGMLLAWKTRSRLSVQGEEFPEFDWERMKEVAADDLCPPDEHGAYDKTCMACLAIRGTRWALQMRGSLLSDGAEIDRIKGERDAAQLGLGEGITRPHESPYDCPTYYDGCHCCVDTLVHNMIRANAAELALSASRADALKAREVLREMAEFHGSAHESGCPEDDTCRCKWKAFNDRVNMACCEPEQAILAIGGGK